MAAEEQRAAAAAEAFGSSAPVLPATGQLHPGSCKNGETAAAAAAAAALRSCKPAPAAEAARATSAASACITAEAERAAATVAATRRHTARSVLKPKEEKGTLLPGEACSAYAPGILLKERAREIQERLKKSPSLRTCRICKGLSWQLQGKNQTP